MYNVTTTIKTGGIETYYWEVSKTLKGLGHDVEIISGNGDFIKYKNITLKQFSYIPRKNIIDLGGKFRKFGERMSFFKNTRSYLGKQKYDIILIRKPFDFPVCYFMKRLNPNITTAFISGGKDFYGFDRFFSKYIDFIFAVSKDNSEKIKARYNRNVKVIPNGVDTEKFFPHLDQKFLLREKFGLADKKVLVSVGRIVEWKGFQLVIEALKELESFNYVLIGDGEHLEELKNLSQKNGVHNRVLFLGAIDNLILPNYLNMADVFIQPSIGHEAFGITIVEAMACGLPVVASNNGGIVDIVSDNVNGCLFEINNIKQMIAKINICYREKDRLSQNAIKHVENNFTWELCAKKLLSQLKIKANTKN